MFCLQLSGRENGGNLPININKDDKKVGIKIWLTFKISGSSTHFLFSLAEARAVSKSVFVAVWPDAEEKSTTNFPKVA